MKTPSTMDKIMQSHERVTNARDLLDRISVDDERFPSALEEFTRALFLRDCAESLR